LAGTWAQLSSLLLLMYKLLPIFGFERRQFVGESVVVEPKKTDGRRKEYI